jgi:hypothetical protein
VRMDHQDQIKLSGANGSNQDQAEVQGHQD